MAHRDEASFRQWLVDKLVLTKWRTFLDEPPAKTAKRLGVQLDVLEEAMGRVSADRVARGLNPVAGSADKRRRPGKPSPAVVHVAVPEVAYLDLEEYCKIREVTVSDLLRSLIFRLLSGPEQPSWIGTTWRYRGKRYPLTGRHTEYRRNGKEWPWQVQTKITHGASRALTARARATGCTTSALLRGVLIDLLEGRTTTLQLVAMDAMFDDENRYWKLEKRT